MVERLIPKGDDSGRVKAEVNLRPLKPGKYCFFIESNRKTAKGCLIVDSPVAPKMP